jgi:hypothetical protein
MFWCTYVEISDGKEECSLNDEEEEAIALHPYSIFVLNMEAVCSSETLVPTYKYARCHNPKDYHGHIYLPGNLKFCHNDNSPLLQ